MHLLLTTKAGDHQAYAVAYSLEGAGHSVSYWFPSDVPEKQLNSMVARIVGLLGVLLIGLIISYPAQASDISASFRGASEFEQVDITYDDLSYILKATVFDAGRSDRSYAKPPRPGIGRHFVKGNTSSTRFEGNRLYFPAFMDQDNLDALIRIRRELEALPGAVPMAEWTRNQQLAYWLNLYNVTIIEELAKRYPETRLEGLLYEEGGLLDRKLLTVAGVSLSLNDIHHRILIPNWQNPLVMYGLYHGYVGSANIRKEAYTADTVWAALKDNAGEFINSNRGTQVNGGVLEVAELYRINRALFPADEALKRHLAEHADAGYAERFLAAETVKATAQDYYIADLMQGVRYDNNPNEGNSAVFASLTGKAQLFFDTRTKSQLTANLPPHVVNYISKIRERKAAKEGTVSVEEYAAPKEDSPEPEEDQ